MIVEPVRPFDQTVVPSQPVAVKTTASPSQIVCLSEVIVGLFGLPTVTVISFDLPLSQAAVLQAAEKVVVVATETVMLEPVDVFDQITVPVQPAAVNVTWPVSQSAVVEAEIIGGVTFPVWITIALELPLVPQSVLQIAV